MGAKHNKTMNTFQAAAELKKEKEQVQKFEFQLQEKVKKVNQLIEKFNLVSFQCQAKLNHDKKKNFDSMESPEEKKFEVSWLSQWGNYVAKHKKTMNTFQAAAELKKEKEQVQEFESQLQEKVKKVNELIATFNLVSLQCQAKLNHDKKKNVDSMESPEEKKFKVSSWPSKWGNYVAKYEKTMNTFQAAAELKKEEEQVQEFESQLQEKVKKVNELIETFNLVSLQCQAKLDHDKKKNV